MTDLEILECCQSIINFLEEDTELSNIYGFDTPSNIKMIDTLTKYKFGVFDDKLIHLSPMADFSIKINQKYKIHDKLWDKNSKEFVSTQKGKDFFKQIIRELKLNSLTK
jgi:hypothetical protein